MSFAVRRMATVTASTKRAQVIQKVRTEPLNYLSDIKCTPLDPLDDETYERLRLDTPHGLLQTFTDDAGYDIRSGDILVVAGKDYPIKLVMTWAVPPADKYLHLILEDLFL